MPNATAVALPPGSATQVNHFLAAADRRRDADTPSPNAAEERGEAVEVVLPPHLERVVVALRTVEPHAEAELTHHRGEFVRLAAVAVEHRGAVGERAAVGGDDLAHEFVVRLVLPEALPQPLVEVVRRLHAN